MAHEKAKTDTQARKQAVAEFAQSVASDLQRRAREVPNEIAADAYRDAIGVLRAAVAEREVTVYL